MSDTALDAIGTGSWLTRQRIQLWALATFAASALGLLFVLITSDGLNDYQNRPLGTDFSNVYAAGTYVREGNAAAAFDWPAQHAREREIFGEKTPFYGWHYPPFFLFVAGLLALMPYAVSLAGWQGVTLALYLMAIRSIISMSWPASAQQRVDGRDQFDHDGDETRGLVADKLWLLLAVAFPAVFVNIGHGHNGFLTAALLGGALVTLRRRPAVSGILFGLIAYKPQFGVMIPLVLLATGRWRTLFAAGATVAALGAVTLFAFGPDVWKAFFASMHLTRVEVLEQGGTGWHKIQSVFSMVRMWGGSVPLAYAMQGVVTVALGAALIWLWRSTASYPLKAGALAVGAILSTPYSLDYDFVALAPAIAFLGVEGYLRGFHRYEKSALAFLWFMPLIARTVAEWTLIPLGAPAMLLVFVLVLRRAANETGLLARWHSTLQPAK